MRLDIFITVKNIEDSINFYVRELRLFEISHDYGMGNILLRYINNKSFCILLEEDENYKNKNSSPIFSISVDDCSVFFEKLKLTSYKNNAGIVPDKNGMFSIIEYALGKNFSLKDPDNNQFLISEWHENAN